MLTVDLPYRNLLVTPATNARVRGMSQDEGPRSSAEIARMHNQGDSPVITALGRVFLFVRYLNDRVLPQLWYRPFLLDP